MTAVLLFHYALNIRRLKRIYSVPVDCLRDLIVDLRRLSLSAPTPTVPSEKADSPTEPLLPLELPVAAE